MMHSPISVQNTKTFKLQRDIRPDALVAAEYMVPFCMVTALFFLWALPNNLNDVLIRQFMKSFQLSRLQAGLVQSAFFLGYFCMSLPAAFVLRRFGYRIGLVSGLLLYAFGCLLFWPAAEVNRYPFFLTALFIIASGLAFLETGAGSFISLLGDPGTSARRLNLSQSFNPPGTIAGALIGTLFIFSGIEKTPDQIAAMERSGTYGTYLHTETLRVTQPYVILAALVFLFAFALMFVKLPAQTMSRVLYPEEASGSVVSLFKVPHFVGAVISQFFYIGAQVGTWSYLIQYVLEYTHEPEKVAGYFLSGTLLIFAVGRFVSTYLMKYVEPNTLIGSYAICNVALVAVAVVCPGWIGLFAVTLSSFFMSPMYPTNFALGIRGLGASATLAASILVMSIIGGALVTPTIGWVSGYWGMARGYLVPLICYLVVAWYGFYGSKLRSSRRVE